MTSARATTQAATRRSAAGSREGNPAQGPGASAAVEARGLVKTFGKTRAVDGVDLSVPHGMVYGLLGPNGAGKTTIVRMLATLTRFDGGSARVLGHDVMREPDAVRSRVSLTGQFASVDEDLTGRENLVLIARLYGFSWASARTRADELLEAFDLTEAAKRQVKKYSGGMRRRLDVAASIVVAPDLLFLDEPTTGLDPRSRNQVWEIVRTLVASGTTVLLTTQYLDEADRLAERIAVIDEGKIIAEGTRGELKASVGTGVVNLRLDTPGQRPAAADILRQELGVEVYLEPDPMALSARVEDGERVPRALERLNSEGIRVTDYSLGQPSLDEVFLALTGSRVEDADTGSEEAGLDAASQEQGSARKAEGS